MVKKDETNPFEMFGGSNGDGKKFNEELVKNFKGKILEIYIGDQSETLNFSETSTPQNCVIIGRFIEIWDRFLVLDCFYIDKATKQLTSGNKTYINTFQIRVWNEINGVGSLNDVFLDINSAAKIKRLLDK
jgi:hypothetical protein